MGLVGNTNQNTYIQTFKGMFTIKVPEGTEGATKRENKNGKVVHEIQFNKLTGFLLGIENRETEDYGIRTQFHIYNEEDDKDAILETKRGSNLYSAIVNRLPNLDLKKPFEIVSKYNSDKERSYYFVNQDGKEVEDKFQTYDKESNEWNLHHGFPAWEQITVKGEKVWDNTKQVEFQEDVIETLMPDIKATKKAWEKKQEAKAPAVSEEPEYEEDEADSGEPSWK